MYTTMFTAFYFYLIYSPANFCPDWPKTVNLPSLSPGELKLKASTVMLLYFNVFIHLLILVALSSKGDRQKKEEKQAKKQRKQYKSYQ
jgi:hypothetical protein